MRVVRVFDVLLEYAFVIAFAAFLVAGVFAEKYFIWAGVALALYFIWGLIRLRCPWCRSTIELWDLLRGVRKGCNCPACGHEITVVWYVNRHPERKVRHRERKSMENTRHEPEDIKNNQKGDN